MRLPALGGCEATILYCACPPVQKMVGMGLARLGKDELRYRCSHLGLVPAQAFRASRSEAAP
jgi:hypothetical protein